ncbi:MAG: thioredoxin domain-containing protein [Pseudomonadota bacterium]
MSTIARRAVLILIFIAAAYTLLGIAHFNRIYYKAENPRAEFLVRDNPNATITLVEFSNYSCGFCREMHPLIEELLKIRKDVRYVIRPISYGEEGVQRLHRLAIAAGLQDKFWEMHEAITLHPDIVPPDSFIEETANLYGIDYKKMLSDADGDEVRKIIEDDISSADGIRVLSVPAFLIGKDIHFVNQEEMPDLKDLLDMIANSNA